MLVRRVLFYRLKMGGEGALRLVSWGSRRVGLDSNSLEPSSSLLP